MATLIRESQPGASEAVAHACVLRVLDPPYLSRLARLAEAIEVNLDRVVHCWWQCYRDAFGSQGFFDEEGFHAWYREDLAGLMSRIRTGEAAVITSWFTTQGHRLRELGVPFAELVLSIHFFEESCQRIVLEGGGTFGSEGRTYADLDALSHVRLAILARTYYEDERRVDQETREEMLESLARLQREEVGRDRFCGMVGGSLAMQKVYELLGVAARSRSTVLLVGESGTGKELAARAIHRLSEDEMDRFVAVNCAAIPSDLIESELFGHRRGAFSGAIGDKTGLFQAAHLGTLFLDEITELPTGAQAKLLRPLQEGRVRPVGATRELSVSLRVIASTNLDLDEIEGSQRLRRDLYYRLQGFVITLPPLRERREDIPILAEHFLEQANRDARVAKRGFRTEALEALVRYGWPGNVRELQTIVHRAAAVGVEDLVTQADLPAELRVVGASPVHLAASEAQPLSLEDAERATIARAMEASEGNKSQAARLLGISRKQLYVKLERYGLRA